MKRTDPTDERTRIGNAADLEWIREEEQFDREEWNRQRALEVSTAKMSGPPRGHKSEAAHVAELARQKAAEAQKWTTYADLDDALQLTHAQQLARRKALESLPPEELTRQAAHWSEQRDSLQREEERLLELQQRLMTGELHPSRLSIEQLEGRSDLTDLSDVARQAAEMQNLPALLTVVRKRRKFAAFEADAHQRALKKQQDGRIAADIAKDAQKRRKALQGALDAVQEHLQAANSRHGVPVISGVVKTHLEKALAAVDSATA